MNYLIRYTALLLLLFSVFSFTSCSSNTDKNKAANNTESTENTIDTQTQEKNTESDAAAIDPAEFNPLKDAYWGDYIRDYNTTSSRKIPANYGEIFIHRSIDEIIASVSSDTCIAIYVYIEACDKKEEAIAEFKKQYKDIGIIEDEDGICYAKPSMIEEITPRENVRAMIHPAVHYSHVARKSDFTEKDIDEMNIIEYLKYLVFLEVNLVTERWDIITAVEGYSYNFAPTNDNESKIWKEQVWPIFDEIFKSNNIDEECPDYICGWREHAVYIPGSDLIKLMKDKRIAAVDASIDYSNTIDDTNFAKGRRK